MTKKEQNAILAEMEKAIGVKKELLATVQGQVFRLECEIHGMEHSMIAFTKTSDKLLQIKANEQVIEQQEEQLPSEFLHS